MGQKSMKISINPAVLRWLRESSGWTLDDVSRYLDVSTNTLRKWETGEDSPTLNEVHTLSRGYKRPFASFFLPQPVKEPPLPQDFRRLPLSKQGFTRKTYHAIRRARNLQSISNELLQNLGQQTAPDIVKAGLRADPEEVANAERERFSVPVEEQFEWGHAHEAFNHWRDLIEQRNVRVLQLPMDVSELRGFTLTDEEPCVIVVNSSDTIEARIFTLIHEYGHVLLHEPALCTPENPTVENIHGAKIENWCNRFAGAFILPKKSIVTAFEEFGLEQYGRIARRYKVSLSTVLTRLVSLKLISQSQYQEEMGRLRSTEAGTKQPSGGAGETAAKRARREKGDVFVSLVMENSQRGYITNSDALDYLDVKTRHLKELNT